MRLPFTLRMARREVRRGGRRLLVFTASITFGVAALVAIGSFKASIGTAVAVQARSLLGADLEVSSRWPFSAEMLALLDSTAAAGTPVSYVTRFASMALAPESGGTRLVQVRSIEGEFPYYGTIETDPPGLWPDLDERRGVLVDPAVLIQLDVAIGDTLAIGEARFPIRGAVTSVPGDIGIRAAIGPRVYLSARFIEETGLLRFGSLARYYAYLRLDGPDAVDGFLERHEPLLTEQQVGYDTVAETEEDLAGALGRLASFLGLVGLVALLLGGLGVASGVRVFVSRKLDTAALLRCLGARGSQVFGVYLTIAAGMGLIGAVAGVSLGLAARAALPGFVRDFLPLDIPFRIEPGPVIAGLAIGVTVAVLFALLPLLRIRDVPPLRALRRDVEPGSDRHDPWRVVVYALIVATVLGLALWQAPEPGAGLAFAAGATATAGLLAAAGYGLMRLARRVPRRARYSVRQGIANLFRPQNQTVAILVALGFGVFLIGTLYAVQTSVLGYFQAEGGPDRPNLVMFDIQPDQETGLRRMLKRRDAPLLQRTPIVSARIAGLRGRPVADLLADSTDGGPRRWALRREYRNTYRDTLVSSERLIAGRWWDGAVSDTTGPPRISMEEEIASDLGVGIGDRITWDVQGVSLETEIASLRQVDWARFEPNFFVVFEPDAFGPDAPRSIVLLTRLDEPRTRAELQRDVVSAYPNVSALDLTIILEAIETVLDRASLAIRFMAIFSIAAGLLILVGALATSRYQRVRESLLLRTLGASTSTIREVLAAEYFALGALAGLTGAALAIVASWALSRFLFELPFRFPALPLLLLALGTAALTTLVGLSTTRDVVRQAPLAGLRRWAE